MKEEHMIPRTNLYIGGTVTTKQLDKILELLDAAQYLGSLKSKNNHDERATCSINEAVREASNQGNPLCVTCRGMEIPNKVLVEVMAMGLQYRLEIESTTDLMSVWTYIDGQQAFGSVLERNPIVSREEVHEAHESNKIPNIIKNMERLSMLPEKLVVLASAREQLAHEKNIKSARSKAQK